MDQQKKTQPVVRRPRGVQRIVSILDASETVFTEMGYDEATTNHIAAQAGISPGSLYQFFSNKEEVIQALAARYTEELQGVYDSVFSIKAASLPFTKGKPISYSSRNSNRRWCPQDKNKGTSEILCIRIITSARDFDIRRASSKACLSSSA